VVVVVVVVGVVVVGDLFVISFIHVVLKIVKRVLIHFIASPQEDRNMFLDGLVDAGGCPKKRCLTLSH
jgi:hypothetical protein